MSLFLPIIEAFNRDQISYVVVGGLAVVLHGHLRMTADVDFVIRLDEHNCRRAVRCIASMGFSPRLPLNPDDFANEAVRKVWIEEKGLMVFSFFQNANPGVSVDLFARYPMDYDEMILKSVVKDLAGVPVRVCAIEDLIDIKRAANRPIDRDDVEALEVIKGDDAKSQK
jgi:hypothetical protein